MHRQIKYIFLFIGFAALLSSCASEERIAYRVQTKKEKASKKLHNFKPSVDDVVDLGKFYEHQKQFVLDGNIEDVWEIFCHTDPRILWHGPKSRFRMAYSLLSETGFYRKESFIPCLNLGMIYNLRLKVLAFYKIPVTFEITKLSHEKKIIEFTYGEDNRSHGKQTLFFESIESGTRITHTSHYFSGNKIRDKKLYPFFHEKYIDEFHENMIQQLDNFISGH